MAQYKGAAREGSRAMQLMKKRELEAQELELRRKKIEEDLKVDKMENKFSVHYDAIEAQLKVGCNLNYDLMTRNKVQFQPK
jgi:protein FAM50